MPITYVAGDERLTASVFIAFVQRVWPGTYDEITFAGHFQ